MRYDDPAFVAQVVQSVASSGAEARAALQDGMRSVILSVARASVKGREALKQYELAVGVDLDKDTVSIQNDAKWAVRLEQGGPAIDMRSYMLRGQQSRNIPMDRDKGSVKQYADANAAPPWSGTTIHAFLTSKLTAMTTVRDEQGNPRLQAAAGEGPHWTPAGMVQKIKGSHVTDPFARMVKMSAEYAKGPEITGFRIWRRLSATTGVGVTWMQPEQAPLHILPAAVKRPEWGSFIKAYTTARITAIMDAFEKEASGGKP